MQKTVERKRQQRGEKTTKEKSCFKVETKQICIPKVRFPWHPKVDCGSCDGCDSGGHCTARCGRVKTILVLKKHKYECPDCKYTWEVASSGACDSGNCDGDCTGNNASAVVAPPSAEPTAGMKVPAVIPAQPAIVTQRATPVGTTKPVIIPAEQWKNTGVTNPAKGADPLSIADIMESVFNVKSVEGLMDFSNAKTAVMFCNGMWCGQSPNNIKNLLKFGYPAHKIKWYRGGMQNWEILGLSTVKGG